MLRRSGTKRQSTSILDSAMERNTDTKLVKPNQNLKKPKIENSLRESFSSNPETEPEPEPESEFTAEVEAMDISSKTHSSLESFKNSSNIELESDVSDTQYSESERDKNIEYICPICKLVLNSSHDITVHIRSHNNESEEMCSTDPSKAYTCKVCAKVLSSASSLDRHVLVHSGERPFLCTVCNMTFTTNGNMNRHKRTHSLKPSSYESDDSTDSNNSVSITTRSKRYENNNNRVHKISTSTSTKRKSTDEDNNSIPFKRKCKNINNNIISESSQQTFSCPVCGREDFASLNVLETHVEESHPEYEVKCTLCDLPCKNYRVLNLHRFMSHMDRNQRHTADDNAVVGFKDLTFVDFSSDKFKYIARAQCEQNIHKSSAESPGFECDKCSRAFPCTSALDIHYKECSLINSSSDNSLRNRKESETSEEDMKRDDFFANLHLQNKSAPSSPEPAEERSQTLRAYLNQSQDNSKDLADIQSIISVASAEGLLKQLSSKSQELSVQNSKDLGEEEAQDSFSAEFRKMKLRGEFPCRLCSAVFPNLRALKGHNRYHYANNNPGPYFCNMCPYSSDDKQALMRHMRNHNGDRPYECSLCNYAFTTKANCERHLRNRHAKVTREEVKQSIIYHVNEDPNNDEMVKSREEPRKSFTFSSPEVDNDDVDRVPNDQSTPLSSKPRELPLIRREHSLNLTLPNDLSLAIPSEKRVAVKVEAPVKIQVKSIDKLINIPEYRESDTDSESPSIGDNIPSCVQGYHSEKQQPIDLSMEVLDLSKKPSPSSQSTPTSVIEPQDFTRRTLDFNSQASTAAAMIEKAHHLLLTQQLLSNGYPKMEPNNFYANHIKQMYMNGGAFPVPTPPFPMNPFFIPPNPFLTPPTNPQDLADFKERVIRGLQLSGGGMVMNNMASLATERLQAFHQQQQPQQPVSFGADVKSENAFPLTPEQEPLSQSQPALIINTDQPYTGTNAEPKRSPKRHRDTFNAQNPGGTKMVLKNGVLTPKQKQRRYRTERPFACEKCQARFTLRSNMERHVKQQHQEYWAGRQREGPARRGPHVSQTVTSSTSAPKQPDFFDISKNYSITEQVKCAILAQQLKSHVKDAPEPDMDEDDALIIDEDADDVHPITKETETKYYVNSSAKKIADQICQTVAKQEFREKDDKDFDYKIATNFIAKSPLNLTRNQSCEPSYQPKPQMYDLKLAQALSEKQTVYRNLSPNIKMEVEDLVPVSRLVDNAVSQLPFGQYFPGESPTVIDESDGDEEGLVASGSTSEGNNSGSDENRSEFEQSGKRQGKKKSAYSMAPNRVTCPYCNRKFPWRSSLRRHILTHTGQKPFKCPCCILLFTTKSNCDRHLNRKHGKANQNEHEPMEVSESISLNNNSLKPSQSCLMRNVPERPFKCSVCPSSTFATLATLNNHINTKHAAAVGSSEQLSGSSRPETPIYIKDEVKEESPDSKETSMSAMTDWEVQIGSKYNANDLTVPSNVQNSELPFKCHLCDGSYPERQDCLAHIKDSHPNEFHHLEKKGALNTEPESQAAQQNEENDDTTDSVRGKFPDYANRKVMCAFCMRRFWSAEDLRRHMRTHTGERPFKCDVCSRTFTLKHSMLRHRKKHASHNDAENNEFVLNEFPNASHDNDEGSISGDEDPSTRSYSSRVCNGASDNSESDNVGGDLIGNLLGISDKGILNKVLLSSADEAAKLLGVAHKK